MHIYPEIGQGIQGVGVTAGKQQDTNVRGNGSGKHADMDTAQALHAVLIVDDDARFLGRLAPDLEMLGLDVAVAYDGTAAIQQINDTHYDLILIDVMMPGMNGMEALGQIKAVNPQAMVIIMAGKSQVEGIVSDTLWSGADGVLHKPFTAQELVDLAEDTRQDRAEQPLIDLSRYDIVSDVLALVPEALARKYVLLPLERMDGSLTVAMADPSNLYAIEDLRVRTGLNIRPLRALPTDIQSALSTYYGQEGEIEREIERIAPSTRDTENEAAARLSAEVISRTPIARAVELMVRQAVKDKASDIHLEPQEDRLRVRYRIDGVLHDSMALPKRVHAPILSRIKVLSHLNIAERRRPQDGQFSMDVDGRTVDIRVATVDTIHGEMSVMRVLDKSVSVLPLEKVGFLPDVQDTYQHIIHAPWGILLIAGPTGSGKTSTLYASINQLDKDEKKIITIEDPVEYRFEGISQMQVNRQANITFATGLRAAMRLDPDIILVGEIRDQETASTAVQASLTGHLVLSSIHANDTVGAILRLIDLGVEPFLVTSSLLGVVSQRLVRRVHQDCAETRIAPASEQVIYERELAEARREFVYGRGCNGCAGTGYRGRVALFELLVMNDEIRRMVLQNANSDEIRLAAEEGGMRSLLQDGMTKAGKGITTPTEVLKNIFALQQRQASGEASNGHGANGDGADALVNQGALPAVGAQS